MLLLIVLQITQIQRIQSRYNGYARLEDLYNQSVQMRGILSLNVQQNEFFARPYEFENATVQHKLDSIEKEREKLRLSKEYLELDKDRNITKK